MLEVILDEIDTQVVSFLDIAEHFSHYPETALLETRGAPGYSFLAFRPFLAGDFRVLEQALNTWRIRPAPGGPPFIGGALGYFSYDFGRRFERIPTRARDELGLPDCDFRFYNAVVIRGPDGRVFLSWFDAGTPGAITREEVHAELACVRPGSYARAGTPFAALVQPGYQRGAYLTAIRRIQEYILAGDVYQVNLTQRFYAAIGDTSAWELYKRLMAINPAPFAGYLRFGETAILSASPERFMRVQGAKVQTCPIKGTVRRGETHEEDETHRQWLLGSAKNRAELAMIVDLMRNDLGRVCRPGSIQVQDFQRLESFASVHHLVATVTGELENRRSVLDLIRASFPGGSITGAPKIRAMEIIEELEPVRRGIFMGAIGYLGFNGSSDLNIAIRTMLIQNDRAFMQVGGGIVADSIPEEEYEESLLKGRLLFEAVEGGL
ncbi:MAG TPA: aminodeoxychorismate synthase component I [Bryobacteraceae bacterium]|jgi:para-aminobenzoate synthetase component 1